MVRMSGVLSDIFYPEVPLRLSVIAFYFKIKHHASHDPTLWPMIHPSLHPYDVMLKHTIVENQTADFIDVLN